MIIKKKKERDVRKEKKKLRWRRLWEPRKKEKHEV